MPSPNKAKTRLLSKRQSGEQRDTGADAGAAASDFPLLRESLNKHE